eukprot:SAG22_NODE_158_length_16966_cov_26.252446_1_plen_119_part_00
MENFNSLLAELNLTHKNHKEILTKRYAGHYNNFPPYSGKYTNNRVIYSWMNNKPWHSLSMNTNGKSIYSYCLEIGKTDEKGDKVLLDYTAPGLGYHSHTTSHHVNLTRCVADQVISNL